MGRSSSLMREFLFLQEYPLKLLNQILRIVLSWFAHNEVGNKGFLLLILPDLALVPLLKNGNLPLGRFYLIGKLLLQYFLLNFGVIICRRKLFLQNIHIVPYGLILNLELFIFLSGLEDSLRLGKELLFERITLLNLLSEYLLEILFLRTMVNPAIGTWTALSLRIFC